MSGIFRYNTNNSTPKRRATLSPFCTSPGQLHDVTMDNTYALGYRSPSISLQHGGNTSPGQGRSVREFEEQMATLRNENFNLKLRLYFLEQKIPGYSSSDGHDNLIKQNVDLKVDIEVLKKELQQKQSLLCEAAKALELMEDQHKENEEKSRGIIDELSQKVQFLEVESKHCERSSGQQNLEQFMGRSDLMGDVDILQKVRELEGQVKQFEQKTEALLEINNELERSLKQKTESYKQQEEKIKQLNFQIDELQEQIDEKNKETVCLERKYEDRVRKLTSEKDEQTIKLSSENKSLHTNIEKLKIELEREKMNFEDRNRKLKEQQHLMEEMQYPKLKDDLQENKKQLEERLQEKTRDHEKACLAIKKLVLNTTDLQTEIERLKKSNGSQSVSYMKEDRTTVASESTALCDNNDGTAASVLQLKLEKLAEEKDSEINNLRLEVKKKTANLQSLVNKELWEKNREIERLTKLLNKSVNSPVPHSPVHDVDPLQQSFTDSDYTLALEQNKRLQSKVDALIQKLSNVTERSSDSMIQQLKMEIREAHDQTEKADRWRKECADVCSILTSRLEELAGFLDSLLKHKDVLGALAADRRRAMRKAVDKSLELSRSLNSMSLSVSGLSIGENSLEFLGNITNILEQTSENKENLTFNAHGNISSGNYQVIENLRSEIKELKKELEKKKSPESATKKDRRSLPLKLDNQSESEAWSEPDRNVSLARIGLEESMAAKNPVSVKEDNNGNTSTDSETDLSRKCKSKILDKTSHLEQLIAQRDNRILQVQCELVEADNRLKIETLRHIDTSRELEEYRKVNEMLEIEIATFKQQINDLEICRRQANEKESALIKLTEMRDQLNVDIRVSEIKVQALEAACNELKKKYERDLAAIHDQEKEKLAALQTELSRQYEDKLRQVENNHKEYLARDWISRIMYDETKRELEDIQKKFTEAQFTIDFMRENETELNAQLIQNEKTIRALRKNVDDATLQSSKVVLERTKALSEKLHLETQLQQLTSEVDSIKFEKENILANNKVLNVKLMNTTTAALKTAKKPARGSDLSQSGYTSEDVPMTGENNRGGVQRSENSSPDLGIESDAGRTSSTDVAAANNKSKPFRCNGKCSSSISSSNNIQADVTCSNQAQVIVSTTGHDCLKVDQENAELRRKLVRTKRAFEDTWKNLRTSNQRKEQVERDIRQQIMKTQNVLKTVRTNMESESATPKKDD